MRVMGAITLSRTLTTADLVIAGEVAERRADDLALARRCAVGDPDAWAQFVRTYQRTVYQLALGVLSHPHDAEDAAQETFVAALTAVRRFRGDSSLATWLSRITVRIAMRQVRRRRVRGALDRALHFRQSPPPPSPEHLAGAQETETAVWEHVATLPAALRLPLVLREFQQFSYREIADVLGVPVGTVQSRLHRARALLRDRLATDRRLEAV